MMLHNHISIFISAITIDLLLFCSCPLNAQRKTQEPKKQTTSRTPAGLKNDTTATFRSFEVTVDLLGAAQMWLSDYGQYEAALRVDLKDKYFPIIEVGYGKADAKDVSTNLHYKTGAPYVRIGLDFNMLKNKHDIYRLYGGFRYGMTSYKFDVTSTGVTDPVWGNVVPYEAKDVKANYQWLEAVAGVDVKISGPIHLGWSIRCRRRLTHNDGDIGNTWYVPGYGRQGGSRLGGTFNLIFQF
jgi:hypothetical protein